MKQFWIGFSAALVLVVVITKGYYKFPHGDVSEDLALMQYGVLFMAAGVGIGVLVPKVKMKFAFGVFAAVVGAVLMALARQFVIWAFQYGWL